MTCCACSCSARYSRTWYCRARARNVERTSAMRVEVRMGRSTTVTLPKSGMTSANATDSRPDLDSTMTGKSDHTGWLAMHARSSDESANSASSDKISVPAPARCVAHNSGLVLHSANAIRQASNTLPIASPSAPVGGRMRTRVSISLALASGSSSLGIAGRSVKRIGLADIRRDAGQDPVEISEGLANDDAAFIHIQLTNRALVLAVSLLDDRNSTANTAAGLEIAE